MDACPFCHAEVTEHLARFGGKCPSCFGLIPGEEAATDPGHTARRAQERDHAPLHHRGRWVLSGLVLVVVAGLIGAAAWSLVRPEPVAKVIDFDEAGYAVGDMQFVAWVEPAPQPVASPRPRPRPAAQPATPAPEVAAEPAPDDAVAAVEPEPEAQSGGLQFGLDVGVSRRPAQAVRLTDDDAIVEMIKEVLTGESRKLKSCYEQRLKTREDLAGRWMLSLVVTRDGQPRDVTVTGLDVQDAEMEACIVGKVAEWSFQPIRADQPIQKTLGFTPGF